MKTNFFFYLTFLAFFVYTGSALAGNEVGSNTYYGENAGGNITTGGNNTFFGKDAGFSNTSGNNNNFFGFGAGYSNTTQSYNTFFGHIAGYYNTANNNTFFGYGAGHWNTTGFQNIYIGDRAGYNNDTGFLNTFIGPESGYNTTTGAENTFIGPLSGYSNDTGDFNTFIGSNAGFSNTSGYSNTFIGPEAGGGNTDGFENTFIGYFAGYSNDTGDYNTFLGKESGYSNTIGNSNVFIGNQAGYNETGSNRLYIDNSDTSTPLIYGEFDNDFVEIYGDLTADGDLIVNNTVGIGRDTTGTISGYKLLVHNAKTTGYKGVWLQITNVATGTGFADGFFWGIEEDNTAQFWAQSGMDIKMYPGSTFSTTFKANGRVGIGIANPAHPLEMASGAHVTTGGVWTDVSSREYKENIKTLSADRAAETLKGLNPVEFNYKVDKEEGYVGFIAEDVPELVATKDRKGLSPMDIVAVLTKVVKEQQKTISHLKEQNKTMNERMGKLEKELKLKGSLAMAETE